MKNKTTTYALMAVVLLIWGYIVYRIYQGVTGDDVPKPTTVAQSSKVKVQEPLLVNNYELGLNYRDPFLGKSVQASAFEGGAVNSHQRAVPQRPRTAQPKVAQVKPAALPMDWSFIQFRGIMKNPSTQRMVSIVFVNGNQYMLEEGAVGGGVKILKVYKDSLKISYNNIKKTITR